jgi:hypothetical protein
LIKFKQIKRIALISLALTGLTALNAQADELPMRKAGLWEVTISTGIKGGNSMPELKIRQCTDKTVETQLRDSMTMQTARQACSKVYTQKTATGYVVDAECATMIAQTNISGDFETSYTMDQTATIKDPTSGKTIHTVTTGKGKWLGAACPAGWKAGDVELPGGRKMNIKDSVR